MLTHDAQGKPHRARRRTKTDCSRPLSDSGDLKIHSRSCFHTQEIDYQTTLVSWSGDVNSYTLFMCTSAYYTFIRPTWFTMRYKIDTYIHWIITKFVHKNNFIYNEISYITLYQCTCEIFFFITEKERWSWTS